VNVQVEYFLTGGFSVLLDFADAVSFCSFFDCYGDSLGDSVEVCDEFLWNVENSYVVRFKYNQRVSLIERSYVKESQCLFVFVNKVGWHLLLGYSAKYACVILLHCSTSRANWRVGLSTLRHDPPHLSGVRPDSNSYAVVSAWVNLV
jgi:hypothetical protein